MRHAVSEPHGDVLGRLTCTAMTYLLVSAVTKPTKEPFVHHAHHWYFHLYAISEVHVFHHRLYPSFLYFCNHHESITSTSEPITASDVAVSNTVMRSFLLIVWY
jgi:hypothetical protein